MNTKGPPIHAASVVAYSKPTGTTSGICCVTPVKSHTNVLCVVKCLDTATLSRHILLNVTDSTLAEA